MCIAVCVAVSFAVCVAACVVVCVAARLAVCVAMCVAVYIVGPFQRHTCTHLSMSEFRRRQWDSFGKSLFADLRLRRSL